MAKRTKDMTQVLRIPVTKDIVRTVEAIFKDRGVTVETWIALQMRALARYGGKTMIGLKDKMQAGKYTGELVDTVCRADTSYMAWTLGKFGKRYEPEVFQLVELLNGPIPENDQGELL